MPDTTNQQAFPIEMDSHVWAELAKYLEPQDVYNLRLVCKHFNKNVESIDEFWQPRLNQLNDIDETISVSPPKGQTIKDAFLKGLEKVRNRQQEEIAYLGRNYRGDFKEHAAVLTNQSPTLKHAISISNALDAMNSSIIQLNIGMSILYNSTELDLGRITRIPNTFFDEQCYDAFWGNLEKFNCSFNLLQNLPKNISKCKQLTELCCFNNQLQTLPKSIGSLKALTKLDFNNNLLQELPEEIGNLPVLQYFNCDMNHIQAIPKSFANKFSEKWHRDALASQIPLLKEPEYSAVEPAPTLLIKRNLPQSENNAKRQRVRPSEIAGLKLDDKWKPKNEKRVSARKESAAKRQKPI